MKRRFFFLLNTVLILSLILVSPAAAKDQQRGLQPGELVTYEQTVPINIVFIGYPRNTIDEDELLDVLPESYAPVVRYRSFMACRDETWVSALILITTSRLRAGI